MTKEDYEKRLMSAAVRVVRAEDGYTISATDNLPGAIKELAAILAERDARIETLETGLANTAHNLAALYKIGMGANGDS